MFAALLRAGTRRHLAATSLAGSAAAVAYNAPPLSSCERTIDEVTHEPRVVAAVVVFRHGSRSSIFNVADPSRGGSGGQSELEYVTMSAVPDAQTSAFPPVPVRVHGGKKYAAYAPPGAPGHLTDVGWSQAVALGRRLRARYGPSAYIATTQSTDYARTVLTARGVLTGFHSDDEAAGGGHESPARIDVARGSTLAVDIGCPVLADYMRAGRVAHRASDEQGTRVRDEIRRSFGALYDKDGCGPLAILDDCLARRFFGHPAHPNVDVSLCDQATRETAREVNAAMRHGGMPAAKLVGGRLLGIIRSELLRATGDSNSAPGSAQSGSRGSGGSGAGRPRLALISGHDTSLLALLNALHTTWSDKLNHHGTTAASDTWPPHCSSIVFELCDNGALRVLYQFEEILPAMPMAAAESDLFAPLMSSEAEHAKLCGLSDADGGAFRWGD